ncbi:hypothetical protein Tco_0316183 [Tanacetum coccineum]
MSSSFPSTLRHEVMRLRWDIDTLHGSVRTLVRSMETCQTEIATTHTGVDRAKQDRASDKEEIQRLRTQLDTAKVTATLAAMDQDRIERELYSIRVWLSRLQSEMIRRGAIEARPIKSIDVLAVYGDARPSGSQGPPDVPYVVEQLIFDRVIEAVATSLAQHEAYTTNNARGAGKNTGGAGGNAGGAGENTRGNIAPEVRGCTYKTFLACNPHTFSGIEGIVGLSRWFEKLESVFQISKCADEDIVKYVVCTLHGHVLTWWNDNVHTLGIDAANQIPWNELKDMMTAEYSVMCPTLFTPEYKKIKHYIWGLPERVQGNVTSFKHAIIPEAVSMTCILVDQAIQAKADGPIKLNGSLQPIKDDSQDV